MALKEKKEREQLRGTRAFRKRALGERRRSSGLFVLVGLAIVLLAGVGVVLLGSSSYLGASPIGSALQASFLGGDEEGASMERVVNPAVVAGAPEPVSEEAATREQAAQQAEAEALAAQEAAAREEAEEVAAAAALAAQEEEAAAAAAAAAEAARLEAEQIAAAAAAEEEAAAAAQAELEAELAAQQPALEEELPSEDGLPEDETASAAVAPADPTMYLDIPKLGIAGAIVAGGEAGLEMGTQLVSGAPWVEGSNTYIAGHRVGFPGTGSDRIFYDLPSMAAGDVVSLTDSNGEVYNYRVSEVFAVTPFDVWVTAPTGSDMVSLQVCTETPEDWWTIGPRLMESGPESGRLIVRAVRV